MFKLGRRSYCSCTEGSRVMAGGISCHHADSVTGGNVSIRAPSSVIGDHRSGMEGSPDQGTCGQVSKPLKVHCVKTHCIHNFIETSYLSDSQG